MRGVWVVVRWFGYGPPTLFCCWYEKAILRGVGGMAVGVCRGGGGSVLVRGVAACAVDGADAGADVAEDVPEVIFEAAEFDVRHVGGVDFDVGHAVEV